MIVHYKRLAGCFLWGQKFHCSPGACSEMLFDRTILTVLLVAIFGIAPLSHAQAVDAQGHPWWKHAVFYELYPRSFADSDNPASYKTHNVAVESKDPDSILQFYQHLLALRHRDPALLEGDYVDLKPNNEALLAYLRRFGDESVLVVLNMSGLPQTVSLNLVGRQTALLSSPGPPSLPKVFSGLQEFRLQPFAVYIARLSR
jgi:hypothetical protein